MYVVASYFDFSFAFMMSSFKMMSCGLLTSGMEKGSIFVLPTDDWLCRNDWWSFLFHFLHAHSSHLHPYLNFESFEQRAKYHHIFDRSKNHLSNILTFSNSIWALKYSKTLVLTLTTTNWTFAKARLLQFFGCAQVAPIVALSEITAYKTVIKKYTHLYTLGQKSWLPPSMQ